MNNSTKGIGIGKEECLEMVVFNGRYDHDASQDQKDVMVSSKVAMWNILDMMKLPASEMLREYRFEIDWLRMDQKIDSAFNLRTENISEKWDNRRGLSS